MPKVGIVLVCCFLSTLVVLMLYITCTKNVPQIKQGLSRELLINMSTVSKSESVKLTNWTKASVIETLANNQFNQRAYHAGISRRNNTNVVPKKQKGTSFKSGFIRKNIFPTKSVSSHQTISMTTVRPQPTTTKRRQAYEVPNIKERTINCPALWAGDKKEIQKAKERKVDYKRNYINLPQLVSLTQNCTNYKKQRRYILDPLSQTEADFPLAFSIVLFKDPAMAERLLRAVYRPNNYYCIHVDKKSPSSVYEYMNKVAGCFDNVFMASRRVEVYWGLYGVLDSELVCMSDLLKYKWKYFINLTGQEFPLRTNYEIVEALRSINGSNIISNLPIKSLDYRWKFSHNRQTANAHGTKAKSPPPYNITVHKGDAHVTLSRAFVHFILHDARVAGFLRWLRDVSCPEEIFYASLQYNTFMHAPGGYKGDKAPLTGTVVTRHKLWDYDHVACGGKWWRMICIYGVDGLRRLSADVRSFYVNKLHVDYEPYTYDCLEELLYTRTSLFYHQAPRHHTPFPYHSLPYFTNHTSS